MHDRIGVGHEEFTTGGGAGHEECTTGVVQDMKNAQCVLKPQMSYFSV